MSELLHFIQDREAAFKSQNRLASLYSDFSAQRTLNPAGYAANLSAWKKALFHACRKGKIPAVAAHPPASTTKRRKPRHGHDEQEEEEASATDYLSFSTGEELARALELRPYGRPTGLSEVIKDAVEHKELVPLNDFLTAQESLYSRRWIPTPWEVVRWSLRSLGLGVLTGEARQHNFRIGRFVVVENVELAAKEVLERQRSLESGPTSGIYSLKTFTSTFENVLGAGCLLSPSDIQVLLRFMSRDRPSLSYDRHSETIKFAPNETTKPTAVEDNDISIAQVKTLALTLELAIPPLERRHAELDKKVREAVASKQISAAKSFLKTRKLIETTLEHRRANLLQVEETLHAIENAATNVEVLQAMAESTKVLKDLNARVGGVEGVERITDAMRDEMQTVDEISTVMAEPGNDNVVVDEGAVDEEFEALMAGERAKEEAERKEQEEKEAKEAAQLAEQEKRRVEAERLKRLEEEEIKEKLRRLEEWERFQKAAADAEKKRALEEHAQKDDDLERRLAELQKPVGVVNEPSPTTQALEKSIEGVKELALDEEAMNNANGRSEEKLQEQPMLAS